MSYEPATDQEVSQHHGARRGVTIFSRVVLFLWGPRGATNLGIYNRRRIAGTNVWSLHAAGRALDVGVPIGPPGVHLGDELFLRFIHAAQACGISEVIWRRQRWTAERGAERYRGSDPHTTHLHLGFTRAIADTREKEGDLDQWFARALIPG